MRGTEKLKHGKRDWRAGPGGGKHSKWSDFGDVAHYSAVLFQ